MELILRELQRCEEITDGISSTKLVKYWPPALVEWSTKAVRDAFYSSPQLSRLLNPDAIKRTISDGVIDGKLGYASKDAKGRLKLEKFHQSLAEADVEISEDMFILKAEDAQKLLEPPRLASVTIRPDRVVLKPGEQCSFVCSALDQYGHPFPISEAIWSATGGNITVAGLYTAGQTEGLYAVSVRSMGQEAHAEARVSKAPVVPPPPPPPGKQTLRWHGKVPPQKWMNFYTKVLTRFASSPGLKLEVSFEVPIESDQARSKLDETRSGLKELGLDDTASMS